MQIELNDQRKKKLDLYRRFYEYSKEEAINSLIDSIEITITHPKKVTSKETIANKHIDAVNDNQEIDVNLTEFYKLKDKPLAKIIKNVLINGGGDEKDIVNKVLYICDKIGKTTSSHNGSISNLSVLRLMRAIIKDIENKRPVWWSTYAVERDQNGIRIILKQDSIRNTQ